MSVLEGTKEQLQAALADAETNISRLEEALDETRGERDRFEVERDALQERVDLLDDIIDDVRTAVGRA